MSFWGRRQAFWLWLGLASLLAALGTAAVVSAYLRDQAPDVVYYETEGGVILGGCSLFGCVDIFDPRPWYAVGGALVALAAACALLTARRR